MYSGLALVAGLSAWAALTGGGTPAATSVRAIAAPVLTVRRAPMALTGLIAATRLDTALDRALGDRPQSCLVVRRGGADLYSRRADLMLTPASNLKLLTATAAIAALGPDTRFTTEARMAGDTLWLVGGGDPVLQTADYRDYLHRLAPERREAAVYTPVERLADAIRAAGVTSITGGIRGDESRYDTQRYIPSWKPVYVVNAEVGPQSALEVNAGLVRFTPPYVAAPSPPKHAADVLAALLRARGVEVTGDTGAGAVPAGARSVARVESPTVRELVSEMLKESDNLTAELLTKELGRRTSGRGTTADGVAATRAALAAAHVPTDQVKAVDGSGLDTSDKASCRALMAAIESAGPTGPIGGALPVAGREGTLAKRFVGHPAAGRLRAKTGSLDGVSSLTGWMDEPAGPPLAFSLVVNGLPRDERVGRAVQEAVGAALARWPDAPDPDALWP